MTKKERIKMLHDLTRAFCKTNLNKEYYVYIEKLIDMLIQNNKYDIDKGKIEILASAVVCIIAKLNLLFEKENDSHISIDIICDHFGANKRAVKNRVKEIESVCNIMMGHEGLCSEEISDALTFLQFENGMIITKAMAKEHGII